MARTVLVVDDSGAFRSTVSAVLEARGFEVIGVAADGAGALDAARELRPDAVLLDVGLPDMDGMEVARRLSAEADAPVVVLISMLDAPPAAVEASGARGFVPKAELGSPRLVELLGAP